MVLCYNYSRERGYINICNGVVFCNTAGPFSYAPGFLRLTIKTYVQAKYVVVPKS